MKCKSCEQEYNFLNGHHGVCDNCHTKGAVSLTQEIALAKEAGLSLYEFRKLDGNTTAEFLAKQTYTDHTGVEREILNLETRKAVKHGFFTEAAGWLAFGVVVISVIIGVIGLFNIDSRDGSGIVLIMVAGSGLVSAVMFGLLSEISMKLTPKPLDE